MLISFLVFLFALFLVLGAYLLATHGTETKRARLQQRLADALLHSAHTEDIEVVLARSELMSEIPWLNRSLIRVQAALQLKRMLDQADLHITPSRLVMFSGMAGMLAALAAAVLSISILLILAAALVAAAIPFVHVWWMRKKRFDRFLEHLPDALDLMSRALSAGHVFAEATWCQRKCRANRRVPQDLRRTKPWLVAQAGVENLVDRIPLLICACASLRFDSTRNRRQPGRNS